MAKKSTAPTKSQVIATIADQTDLTKKQVAAVFDALNGVIKKSLKGAGVFTLPGLAKLRVVKKAATKTREGVNPFTGEKITIKAKPASKRVRVRALKNLNEMVG
ncbi:MAG: HU family DNA-binding protein [Steroidobacteraceae bacterium]|jgi:DNA-binding protein HU-beta|nr:HU family DNA-binding protein [Steroidobacteraceae bacterium]MCC7200695.1 HU family DNA-binding protein [Gammaproteobacteria bacterium]